MLWPKLVRLFIWISASEVGLNNILIAISGTPLLNYGPMMGWKIPAFCVLLSILGGGGAWYPNHSVLTQAASFYWQVTRCMLLVSCRA